MALTNFELLSAILVDRTAGSGATFIQGNFIGLLPDGKTRALNGGAITVNGDLGGVTIGGTSPDAANVIGGDSGDEIILRPQGGGITVQGNQLGLNAAGNDVITNVQNGDLTINGIDVLAGLAGAKVLIGGTIPGAGNVISGEADAISINSIRTTPDTSTGAIIQGNLIGTDVTGTKALGNVNGLDLSFRANNTVVGGTIPGAGNVISGNLDFGVNITQSVGITLQGNFIGTDRTGTLALGNGTGEQGSAGVRIEGDASLPVNNTIIGGSSSAARNVISGNLFNGIKFDGPDITNTLIQGNSIGVDATGSKALGNGANGIDIANDSIQVSGNGIKGNIIAHNGQSGILLEPVSNNAAIHIPISQNMMFANGGLGIDLSPQGTVNCNTAPPGHNDYTACPVVSTASSTQVSGTAPANATVEVFIASNETNDQGHGEGQTGGSSCYHYIHNTLSEHFSPDPH